MSPAVAPWLAAALLAAGASEAPPAPAPGPAPAPASAPAPAPAPAEVDLPPSGPVAPAPGAAGAYGLPELVQAARAGNSDLAALRDRRTQADAQLSKAWASLYPVVSAAASYTRNSSEAKLRFPDFTQGFSQQTDPATGTVFLIPNAISDITIQPLDQLGAMGRVTVPLLVMPAYYGIASAGDAVEATEQGVTHARSELLFGVAQAYYGASAAQRMIELAESQLRTAAEQERISRLRFEAGQVPKIAFLRAGVDRARAEQDVRRAQNALGEAKLALAALTGLPAGELSLLPPPPLAAAPEGTADELVSAALTGRKDLEASRTAGAIADRSVRAEWWRYAPILAASGEYRVSNVEGFTGETSSWLVQVAATVTLYEGGRYADLDLARARASEAAHNTEALRRRVEQEVRTALLALESANANLLKAREQERLANENATLVQAQVDAGVATYLDGVDARSARFAAGVAAVSEELNVEIASLRVAKATGRLFSGQTR